MDLLTAPARQSVLDILDQAHDLTIATIRQDGFPQATIVSFIHHDLLLYAAVGIGSQKAENIRENGKVAVAVALPYGNWLQVRGISLGGRAGFLTDEVEMARVSEDFQRKFPDLSRHVTGTSSLPWTGQLFLCIEPQVISLIDYRTGFGNTMQFAVPPGSLTLPSVMWGGGMGAPAP